LQRAQRQVSRRKQGSHRRRKAVRLLARAHQRVRRARGDLHHKVALALVRQYDTTYDTTYDEDLQTAQQTAHLLKNHRLAQSSADAGWRAFLGILACKAACAGKRAVAVPPASTSQRCSGPQCNVLVATGLSIRWHSCPACGTSLQRDHNAARNIERLGQSLRGAVA
jgi:putative transposase